MIRVAICRLTPANREPQTVWGALMYEIQKQTKFAIVAKAAARTCLAQEAVLCLLTRTSHIPEPELKDRITPHVNFFQKVTKEGEVEGKVRKIRDGDRDGKLGMCVYVCMYVCMYCNVM